MKTYKTFILILLAILCSGSILNKKSKMMVSQPDIITNIDSHNCKRIFLSNDSVYAELNEKRIKCPVSDSEYATLTIYNNTNTVLCTVHYNTTEKYVNGKWVAAPLRKGSPNTFAVEASVLTINPHEKKVIWFSFHSDRYVYSKGKYRIKKPVWFNNPLEKEYIYAEFKVTD